VASYARDVLGHPEGWQVAHQAELFGQVRRVLACEPHVLVYAGDERRHYPPGVRAVGRPLAVHFPTVEEEPGRAVLLDEERTEDFGEQPEAPTPPQVYLPQAVAGGIEPLGEKSVVGGRSVDVGHPPSVDEDLHRCLQAVHDVRDVVGSH
jgi:hypothetical protein